MFGTHVREIICVAENHTEFQMSSYNKLCITNFISILAMT